MPPRASINARELLLSFGAIALVGGSLAGGWWQGQRSRGTHTSSSQVAVERQAEQLRQRLADGTASEAEQQRLVQLLLVLNQQEEATVLLEQLADQQPKRWQLRLLLAELHRTNNNRSAAERELRQLLNLSPDRIEALQLMTLLQLEQGRGNEAQGQLKAQIEKASKPALQPQVLPLGLLLGDLQQRMGQNAAAGVTYTKLASDFPRDPRPLLALALLRQEQGDAKAAQEALAQARSRQPGSRDNLLDRVAASWGISNLRQAETTTGAVPDGRAPNRGVTKEPSPGTTAPGSEQR
ncbi:tetratricopeptide repeat protein [Vulcanococcus sp. Clear-D1]|uniref:tetratricopeptide repeat protein n=1 Tax=Vulcanococcus sp. Clear-D1 TaxID=2766970 RepID=UPI00198371D3|nr:tetratricopeptide repeat protein [Vulcanococcus sp. Clear-D1]MBD1193187.1 tetratricopeptide repeat protein [Vulcanococcus sp. Clear-D1]